MKKQLIPLLIVSTAIIAGCKNETTGATSPVVDKGDAIAEVNGIYISKAAMESLKTDLSARMRGQTLPDDQLITELVNRELLVQEAMKKGLENDPALAIRLDSMRKSMLAQADMQSYLDANPVSDEELKAEYDKKFAGDNQTEYKARHILVKTEDEGKAIVKKLDKGDNFEELAKKNSTGPSAPQGGDLGWFSSDRMVAPFSEAVIVLEDGKYTTEPVKTQFGWHVILREESREKTPPPFDTVKDQFKPLLERNKVQSHLDALRAEAKINILEAPVEDVVVEETILEEVTPESEPAAPAPATQEKEKTEQK